MSKRGAAVHRRAHPHMPIEGDPGCCTCGLPMAAKNQLHLEQLPPTDPDVAAAEQRRIADKE